MPHPDSTLALSEKELAVADWAFRQRKAAGRFTDNLPGAESIHLPLATDRKTFGVLAVSLPAKTLPLAQRELLGIFAQQTALALDRIDLRSDAEQARLLAESERLSRVLLNSISHELRTPLAAISTAASSLVESDSGHVELRRALVAEIQEANARLNRVVGNLLDLARLEHGNMRPRLDWHDARDVVHTTLRELKRELAAHPVTLDLPTEPLLVWVDFSLIQHALANLLLNSVMHTPAGTPIEIARPKHGRRRGVDGGRSRPRHSGRGSAAHLRQILPCARRARRRQRPGSRHREGFRRSARRSDPGRESRRRRCRVHLPSAATRAALARRNGT